MLQQKLEPFVASPNIRRPPALYFTAAVVSDYRRKKKSGPLYSSARLCPTQKMCENKNCRNLIIPKNTQGHAS